LAVVILLIGVGLVVWKKKGGGHSESYNQITRHEIELLLADVAKTNPMVLKRLNEDPEMKKQQTENLKQLLAFASQAQKEGYADDPTNSEELDSIESEIVAVNYDREINKDKGPMPPFGFITEEQIKAFWEGSGPVQKATFLQRIGLGEAPDTRTNEEQFDAFLNAKIASLKATNPEMKDREISEEEKTQARDIFAKIRIYENEYKQKAAAGELSSDFVAKTNLQVKLQQAQFLAKLYSDKAAEQLKVTDDDVAKYVEEHPELKPETKKAKADEILARATAGEDFANLANEFSEDPGNMGPDGQKQGGLYKDVPKGRMVGPFEEAALALQPGQVATAVIPTDFGYHIIKLERSLSPSKGDKTADGPAATGDTYDVRHILISTMVKDPDNPASREMPVKDFVRNKLETEKEKALIAMIVASNGVSVPEDFTVPEVSEQQLQEMRQKQQQQQMQMQPPPQVEPEEPAKGKKK
jgi:hypothetical protein